MMEGRGLDGGCWVRETIGAGGVTEVSLAQDTEMGERVALRLLAARFSDHREILRDACRESRQLAHPHIARVFDFYSGEEAPFVCREYVEGANIGEISDHSTAKPVTVSTAEPVTASTAEPVTASTAEPVTVSTAEPVTVSTAEPAVADDATDDSAAADAIAAPRAAREAPANAELSLLSVA